MVDLFGAAGVLPVDAGQLIAQYGDCAHNPQQPVRGQSVGYDPVPVPTPKLGFESVGSDPTNIPPTPTKLGFEHVATDPTSAPTTPPK